jgi:cytochrome c556
MNGKPAPSGNADWQKWVAELRTAGMTAYKAAQAKSQDAVLEAADVMSVACSNCHDKYRETPGGIPTRCQ